MEGRCFKCKDNREMKDVQEIEMKGKGNTKRRAAKGVCSKCGCKMFKFLPALKKAA